MINPFAEWKNEQTNQPMKQLLISTSRIQRSNLELEEITHYKLI